MIDASKGFVKDGNKNRLRHQDIRKIVDVFTRQIELPKYSRLVSVAEIETHDYNLNIPRYIDSTEPEDLQDIEAHLLGGIPNRDIDDLAEYWQVFPTLRDRLFAVGERPGYSQLKAEAGEIKPAIFAHPEFMAYTQAVNDLFAKWKAKHTARLKGLVVGSVPKALIEALAEDLLLAFAGAALIDKYDVYQHLMSYWTDTMQDDVYMIVVDGWQAGNDVSVIDPRKEKAELVIGRQKLKGSLIPAQLLVDRYFAVEQQAIEKRRNREGGHHSPKGGAGRRARRRRRLVGGSETRQGQDHHSER